MIKAPLLAATIEDIEQLKSLRYPVLTSEKKDGHRGFTWGGKILSRKLIEIPNRWLQKQVANWPAGLEGELVVQKNCKDANFEETASCLRSEKGKFDFKFYVFDCWCGSKFFPFRHRIKVAKNLVFACNDRIEVLEQTLAINHSFVNLDYSAACRAGKEGIMIRDPNAFYKFGRSTLEEQALIKLKPWIDSEASVLGFEEKKTNNNPQERDNLGLAKRSKKIANLQTCGTLGAIAVKHPKMGEFKLGTGWTEEQANMIWTQRKHLVGETINFRYRGRSKYGIPKHAAFVRFIEHG